MIQLGEVGIANVVEIPRSTYPTTSMLPDSTAADVERHYTWLKPHFFDDTVGDLASRIQTYIVRTPEHTVLVDTGVGNDKAREENALWHRRRGTYLEDLAAAGVAPDQVDVVVCTHLHVDHVGWNTRLVDGRWVPTFPDATSDRHLDFQHGPSGVAVAPNGRLDVAWATLDTPLGPMAVFVTPRGVVRVAYDRENFGEVADEVATAYEQVKALEHPPAELAHKAVYYCAPPLEQVRAWIAQAGLTIEEEGRGSSLQHFIVRRR